MKLFRGPDSSALKTLGIAILASVLGSQSAADDCWDAVGSSGVGIGASEQGIVRGEVTRETIIAPADPLFVNTFYNVGERASLEDAMVSLRKQVQPGIYSIQYGVIPRGRLNPRLLNATDVLFSAQVFLTDPALDRVVLQFKSLCQSDGCTNTDPDRSVRTLAILDSSAIATGPQSGWQNMNVFFDIPSELGAGEDRQYFVEADLITDRSANEPVPRDELSGPALAAWFVCATIQ